MDYEEQHDNDGRDQSTLDVAMSPDQFQASQQAAALKANSEAVKEQAEYGMEQQKRIAELQIEVIHQCVAKGGVPVIMNGNIDCKAALR